MSDPLSYLFAGVPAGGKVEVMVMFYSGNEWLAGKGTTGPVQNIISNPQTGRLEVTITIKEYLVPLTTATRYQHKQKLEFSEGAHRWIVAAAPAATRAALSCQADTHHLCELASITLSEDQAMLGYAWEGAGGTVKNCDGGTQGSQLYQQQNISLKADPELGLAHSGCGLTKAARLAYKHEPSVSGWIPSVG